MKGYLSALVFVVAVATLLATFLIGALFGPLSVARSPVSDLKAAAEVEIAGTAIVLSAVTLLSSFAFVITSARHYFPSLPAVQSGLACASFDVLLC